MSYTIDKEQFIKLASSFSILCVCEGVHKILGDNVYIFKHEYVSDNKEKALNLFDKNDIDIVFIDVDTPDIHWLSLVKSLRKKQYDVPICIIINKDNKERLATAITAGITQCLFKPMDRHRLDLVIFDIVKKLQNKKDAKELHYKKEEEKLHNLITSNTQSIIREIPFPMVIYHEDEVLFTNLQMRKLLEDKGLVSEEAVSLKIIESMFDNIEETTGFYEISTGKHYDIKYHYQHKNLKKVFLPTKYEVAIGDKDKCVAIVLNDIAPLMMQIRVLQYQTNKIETYKQVIENLLIKNIFKTNDKSLKSIAKKSKKTISDIEPQTHIVPAESDKISASEYIKEVEIEVLEEVSELESIEGELQIAIDGFTITHNESNIAEISKMFSVYGRVIAGLIEFIDLGHAILSLADFVEALDVKELKENRKGEFYAKQLELILDDLANWRKNVFVSQKTLDIHYLDTSIFSSILQLQLNDEKDDDEGELELF